MSSGQGKMRLPVFDQRKGRRLVGFHVVAAVARIEIRGGGKLLCVAIVMAVGTVLEFHLE